MKEELLVKVKEGAFRDYLQKYYPKTLFQVRQEGQNCCRLDTENVFDAAILICQNLPIKELPTKGRGGVKKRFESSKFYLQIDEGKRVIKIKLKDFSSQSYERSRILFDAHFSGAIFIFNPNIWTLGLEALSSTALVFAKGGINSEEVALALQLL